MIPSPRNLCRLVFQNTNVPKKTEGYRGRTSEVGRSEREEEEEESEEIDHPRLFLNARSSIWFLTDDMRTNLYSSDIRMNFRMLKQCIIVTSVLR